MFLRCPPITNQMTRRRVSDTAVWDRSDEEHQNQPATRLDGPHPVAFVTCTRHTLASGAAKVCIGSTLFPRYCTDCTYEDVEEPRRNRFVVALGASSVGAVSFGIGHCGSHHGPEGGRIVARFFATCTHRSKAGHHACGAGQNRQTVHADTSKQCACVRKSEAQVMGRGKRGAHRERVTGVGDGENRRNARSIPPTERHVVVMESPQQSSRVVRRVLPSKIYHGSSRLKRFKTNPWGPRKLLEGRLGFWKQDRGSYRIDCVIFQGNITATVKAEENKRAVLNIEGDILPYSSNPPKKYFYAGNCCFSWRVRAASGEIPVSVADVARNTG